MNWLRRILLIGGVVFCIANVASAILNGMNGNIAVAVLNGVVVAPLFYAVLWCFRKEGW